MLQIAIVVFREILEISLILGILAAATKDVKNRTSFILGGVFLGVIISIILAFFTDSISGALQGMGQEFFNGLILLAASFMIGWTVLWMQKHAKTISGELKKLGNSVREGKKPLYALSIVVLLSILREGLEIVLFTYSYYISGESLSAIIFGLIVGIFAGSILGCALYFGLLKAFGKYFFAVTSWMLIFFSCGIAMLGIGFWSDAGIVPALKNPAIDLSQILPQEDFLGKILNIFFGYIDQPSLMQLIVYFATLAILAISMKIAKKV